MRKFLLITFVSIFVSMALSTTCVYASVPLNTDMLPEGMATISGQKTNQAVDINLDKARIQLTQRIVNILFGVAGVIAIFFILLNGFWLTSSAGREEALTQHKKGLMWAVVGLMLVILSYAIVRFVISVPFKADEAMNQTPPAAAAPAQPPAPAK